MDLEETYETREAIPAGYEDLFTERDGKFKFTAISNLKTQTDIDKLDLGIKKERAAHAETKAKLSLWGDLDHADVQAKLDRFPELEAAASGKLDEAQIEEIVARRVDGTLRSKLAPVERENKKLKDDNAALSETVSKFETTSRRRKIHDEVLKHLIETKARPEAHEDALLHADRVLEINELDQIVTRDQVGVTPGLGAKDWLSEMQPIKPHWWPGSAGGNAHGSRGGGNFGGPNPFSADGWNLTQQGAIVREKGEDVARRMAEAAGTTVGGPRPRKA